MTQLYKKDNENYKEIYPYNYIQNIIDKDNDEKLEDILVRNNSIYCKFDTNINITKSNIPIKYRKTGLIITYIYNSKVYTEQYIGSNNDIYDNERFINNKNWNSVSINTVNEDISSYNAYDDDFTFWSHAVVYNNEIYKICSNGTNASRIYKSSDNGKTFNLILAYNEKIVGDSAVGVIDNYLYCIVWRSETQTDIYKFDLDDITATPEKNSATAKINDDNYIITDKIVKTGNSYWVIGYNRKGNTFATDGIWRKIAYFRFNKDISDSNNIFLNGENIVNFTNAPGTPTSVTSTAVFVDEPFFCVDEDEVCWLVLRTVGDTHSQYNRGFYITKGKLGDGGSWFSWASCYGTENEIGVNAAKAAYIYKDFSQGGHFNGLLPRVAVVSDKSDILKNKYLFIYAFCRNLYSTASPMCSAIYYIKYKITGITNVLPNNSVNGTMWKELSEMTPKKLCEAFYPNIAGSSPEGGNGGNVVINGQDIFITNPTNKAQKGQDIYLTLDYIINKL